MSTWQPGEPLYAQHDNGGASYRLTIFNFRDDAESDECHCADAASWPNPRNRPLADVDELEQFIAEWHRWRETQETPA